MFSFFISELWVKLSLKKFRIRAVSPSNYLDAYGRPEEMQMDATTPIWVDVSLWNDEKSNITKKVSISRRPKNNTL